MAGKVRFTSNHLLTATRKRSVKTPNKSIQTPKKRSDAKKSVLTRIMSQKHCMYVYIECLHKRNALNLCTWQL